MNIIGLAKPKLLDLYCGQGCIVGTDKLPGYCQYFDVTGVDFVPQKRYPHAFVQSDALDYLAAHGHKFDAIHASPPCEGFSKLTLKKYRPNHANLIPHTRYLLQTLDKPYVIENVKGARKQLRNPVMLCGSMFGLPIERHRYFEVWPEHFELITPCCHIEKPIPINSSSAQKTANKAECSRGLGGVYWATRDGMRKGIPPAYGQWLGRVLFNTVQGKAPAVERWDWMAQFSLMLEVSA